MPRPTQIPLGLELNQAARVIGQAFDDALQAAGGSLPVWLILLNLKVGAPASQRELAAAVGIREATLTHHLNTLESAGWLVRQRDPANRRVHVIAVTDLGEAAFHRLRAAAQQFDGQLRDGLSADDRATFSAVLARLVTNVGSPLPDFIRPTQGDGHAQ